MNKPSKVFVAVECGNVTETLVTGDANVEVVVLDFDALDIDPEEARQLLLDHGDDLADINAPAGSRDLRERLQDIVDEADAEEDDFEEEDDEDYDEPVDDLYDPEVEDISREL